MNFSLVPASITFAVTSVLLRTSRASYSPRIFTELVFLELRFDIHVNGCPEDREPLFRQRIADEHSCVCHKNPYNICTVLKEGYRCADAGFRSEPPRASYYSIFRV